MKLVKRVGLAIAVLIGIVVASCATPRTSLFDAFEAAFPAGPGDFQVKALPVTLIDRTGLVRAMAVSSGRSPLDPLEGIEAVPGAPNELFVGWVGGACEGHVTAILRRGRDGLSLHLESAMQPFTLGCVALGIHRELRLTFRSAISPVDVVLS